MRAPCITSGDQCLHALARPRGAFSGSVQEAIQWSNKVIPLWYYMAIRARARCAVNGHGPTFHRLGACVCMGFFFRDLAQNKGILGTYFSAQESQQ